MHANTEIGTIQDLRAIADIAHAGDIVVHTDAAQSVGKVPVRMDALGVDMLTVAGHKLYAPQGVGALIVRRGMTLEPHIRGAGHEHGLRAGTENVPYIVALGWAAELGGTRLHSYQDRVRRLRDTLHQGILDVVPAVLLNGHPAERLPNTLNLSFPSINAAALLARIRDEVACSMARHGPRGMPSHRACCWRSGVIP